MNPSKTIRSLVTAAVFASLAGFAAHASAEPAVSLASAPPGTRVLTLDDCIATALAGNVDARSTDADVRVAESARTGSRGELLPRLHADGAVQQWDSAFALPFALPGVAGPAPVLTVRDAFTWTGSVSVIQPITGLLAGLERYAQDGLGVDIAKLQREASRRDVGFRVAEQYLRLLEAKRLVEVAAASVVALEGQRRQAVSLHANGVIAKNDLLRAELALSNAKQREIQARGSVVMARGRLGTLLGLPSATPVDAAPLGLTGASDDSLDTSVETAEAQASSRRLEVRAFDSRVKQADSKITAAREKLLPQISGVANYTHFEGSAFQQKNAAYVGLVGSWDIWDWGATLSAAHEAEARREQAKLARIRIDEQIRLEARQAAVDAQAAREALEVARTAVAQADENYRIVSRRFEQAAGTAFDVVDAEALLTQSRAQVETATYGSLVARLGLQRATGEMTPRVR
jgi:outer membrane protein TolC